MRRQNAYGKNSLVFSRLRDPFNYPLEPIGEKEFERYYQPIKFDEPVPASVLEIRKYEDMPIRSTAPMGRVERKGRLHRASVCA